MQMLEHIIRLVAPHYCLGCDTPGDIFCRDCLALLSDVPPRCYRCGASTEDFRVCKGCRSRCALFQAWTVTIHEGPAKTLIHRLKFERARAAAAPAAAAIAAQVPGDRERIVTHIPTASSRVRARGYDQAQLIARRAAKLTGSTYTPLLVRFGQHRQVGQTRKVRQRQMAEAFRPVHEHKIRGKHVLLIDDVLTTGSTLEAAAATLKAAGAKRVSAAVFAAA